MGRFDELIAREIEGTVSTDADDLVTYGRDWTRVHDPSPSVIVFPHTAEDVARVIQMCAQEGVAVVPSGGRTGLAGGAVATRGEVVLSMERMRRMEQVDTTAMTVRVEAGAVTQALHEHVGELGLSWPIDLAAKGSSQIGGNIATNAGGVRVIRYGHTRNWVLGLEVVTAKGELLHLNGALEKNNTGADLRQLFIGSEGTLGVVTAATLKLVRPPARTQVLLFEAPTLAAVLEVLAEARRGPFELMAFEFFTDACMVRLEKHRGLVPPFDRAAPYYVLIDVEGSVEGWIDDAGSAEVALMEWTEKLLHGDAVLDGVIAQSRQQSNELWELREGISESLTATGMPSKNDVSVPVSKLDGFCKDLETALHERYGDWEVCLFGHVGDGNIHVNVMKPNEMSKEEFVRATEDIDRTVYEVVQKYGGSISAEHGVGLLKKPYLHYSHSEAEIEALRALKRAFDPEGILNPGKIVDV